LDEKNNFSKKTDNKKTDNKKNIIIIIIVCVIISVSVLSLTFAMNSETLPKTSVTMSDYIETLPDAYPIPIDWGVLYFDLYLTNNDATRVEAKVKGDKILDGARITLNESTAEQIIDILKPNDGTVVIYPIFTSAAYSENGFYTYYDGNCDESCITDISFENPEFKYTSSGFTAQILYDLGYEFLTDIEVDKNPELLQNYDTVILLHNEYVTKKMFDAISNHPNLIFLFPNTLYAEIDVNYDDNTMTLIRGHNYPEKSIRNGFDYAIEQEFHDYEYDSECLEWKFIEFENGFHLNCYPDAIIQLDLEILLKMKEL
jgi:flagellar basal body-associated protein FliL